MKRTILALWALCISGAASADYCRETMRLLAGQGYTYHDSWKSDNPRYLWAQKKVAQLSGTRASKIPVICESENTPAGPTPVALHVLSKTSVRRAIVLPTFVARFSDEELLGIVAHEFAHFRKTWAVRGLSHRIHLEAEVDVLAASWVGRETVIKSLRAANDMYTSEQRKRGIKFFNNGEFEYRLERLMRLEPP